MKHYFFLLAFFIFQISSAQFLEEPRENLGLKKISIEVKDESSFQFKNYGDLWFSTLETLIDLGEIPGFDEQPVSTQILIFPDSTIYAGYDATGPFVTWIHGVADMVNPTTLPTDYTKDWYWATSVIDSVSIPYFYFRTTEESIEDTVFIDYLNHVSFSTRVGHIPMDDDFIPEKDEFIHQPILHTGETDELDDDMVLRTDTVVLSADAETVDFARSIGINTNDTVYPGQRYGVYVRFKPGYEWNKGNDTILNYNQFGMFMREQDEGERPAVLWDSLAGFGSYLNTINCRYNIGDPSAAGQLLVGFVGNEAFPYEHAYVRYKMATNALSVPENLDMSNLELFPNPFSTGILQLDFDSQKDQSITFNIFDLHGRLVYSENRDVFIGSNNLTFTPSHLAPGTYQFVAGELAKKLVVK